MFCKDCGQEIAPGTKFCGNCGSSVDENLSQNTEAPAQYEATTETPASDAYVSNSSFAQADFDTAATPAKKKSALKPLLISGIALILVVAIVLSIVIFKKSKDKNTDPSISNIVNVLSQNTPIDEKVHSIVDLYDNLDVKKETSQKMQLKVNISEEAAEVFNSLVFNNSDLKGDFAEFNNITLDYTINLVGNLYQCNMVLNNSGQPLIDLDIIYDFKEMKMYYGLPSLNDTYLCISMGANNISDDYTESVASTNILKLYYSFLSGEYKFSDILPTEEEIDTLIDTYLGIAKPYLENDSEVSTTLTVGEISQSVTECTMNITESELKDMLVSILEKAKTDSTIYTIVDRAYTFISDKDIIPEEDLEDFSKDDIEDAIDDAISELKEETVSDEIIFSLVRYVNSDNKIIGRKISAEGEEVLYHATVKNGSQYSTVFEFDEFELIGNGTVADNKKTGTYSVAVGDNVSFDFNIKDFYINSDGIGGSVIYYFEKEDIEDIIDNSLVAGLIGNAKVGIELKLSGTEGTGNVELNLIAGDNILCGLSAVTESSSEVANITIPSKTMPQDKADEWANNFDEEEVKNKFKNSPFGFLIDMYEENAKQEDSLLFEPVSTH